ncbi:putative alpha-xylosidase [Verticillium dahliae]
MQLHLTAMSFILLPRQAPVSTQPEHQRLDRERGPRSADREYSALDEAYSRTSIGSEPSSTGLSSVQDWFPPGAARYVVILTGLVHDVSRELAVFRPLHEMPVFAREGSIIPLDAAVIPENGGKETNGLCNSCRERPDLIARPSEGAKDDAV